MSRKPSSNTSSPLDAYRHLMGKQPDHAVAALAGVQRKTVISYRQRFGIPAYQGYKFTSDTAPRREEEPPPPPVVPPRAAKAPAPVVAAPAFVEPPKKRRGRPPKIRPVEALPVAAPVAPPVAVAPKAESTIRVHRKSKLDAFVAEIGSRPDREIAEKAKVTAENVRAYRQRRGIPARWRGEGVAATEPARVVLPVAAPVVAKPAPAPVPVVEVPKKRRGRPPKIRPIEPAPVAVPEAKPVAAKPAALVAKVEAPVVEPVVAKPVAAIVQAKPEAAVAKLMHAFVVAVDTDGKQEEFVVVGLDIAQAAAQAINGLSRRAGPWKVLSIRYLAEALVG
jgi:hypothetical protein